MRWENLKPQEAFMAAQQPALSALNRRPLRAFSVSLSSPGGRLDYTALARRSGDALCDALTLPQLALPVTASVKPAPIFVRK